MLDGRVTQLNGELGSITGKIEEFMAKTKADAESMSDDDVVATLEVTVVGAKGDIGDVCAEDAGAACIVTVEVDADACAPGAARTARSSALCEGDTADTLAPGRRVTTAYGKGKVVAVNAETGMLHVKTAYGVIYAPSQEGVSLEADPLPTAAALGATHMCNESFEFPVTRFDNKPGANVVVTLAKASAAGAEGEAAEEALEALGEVKMPMKLVDMGGMGADRPFEEWFRMKPVPPPPRVVGTAYGEGEVAHESAKDGSMMVKLPWGVLYAKTRANAGIAEDEPAPAPAPAPTPSKASEAADEEEGAAEAAPAEGAVTAAAAPVVHEKPKFFALRLRLGLTYADSEKPRRQRRNMVLMLKRHEMMLTKELAQMKGVRDQMAVMLQQQQARGVNATAIAEQQSKLKEAMAAAAAANKSGGGRGGGSSAIQSAEQARQQALAAEDGADDEAATKNPGPFARMLRYCSEVAATQEFNLAKNASLFVFGSIGFHFFGDQFVV